MSASAHRALGGVQMGNTALVPKFPCGGGKRNDAVQPVLARPPFFLIDFAYKGGVLSFLRPFSSCFSQLELLDVIVSSLWNGLFIASS